ncbi:MAG: hypothetical protein LBU81_05100 [Methanosarcinales archaeon]|jgi:hypothetical protein|nr:hypothetical protein [Methanosarcinales archaeon]
MSEQTETPEQNQENIQIEDEEEWGEDDEWETIEEIERRNKMLFEQLIKIGNFGYQSENMRQETLFTQTNGIFTVISIYSLAVLTVFSSKIIILAGGRLYLFLGLTYMFLFISLMYGVRAQVHGRYLDMGTIDKMDSVYTNVMINGIALDSLYVSDLNEVHLNRRDINDKKQKFISYSYVFLFVALTLPIILGALYIL